MARFEGIKMELEKITTINFEEFRNHMELEFKKIKNLSAKRHLCLDIARLYKGFSGIDGIKEDCLKEVDYFLKKANKYHFLLDEN